MPEDTTRNGLTIEGLILMGIIAAVIYWIVRWIRLSPGPQTSNPWSEEVESAVQDPDAIPICHRCFTPQDHNGWFCPNCGTATGPYNNWMPYLSIFSEGEVLRAGILDHMRPGLLVRFGYVFYSAVIFLTTFPLFILALPWNLYLFFQNLQRQEALSTHSEDNQAPPPFLDRKLQTFSCFTCRALLLTFLSE